MGGAKLLILTSPIYQNRLLETDHVISGPMSGLKKAHGEGTYNIYVLYVHIYGWTWRLLDWLGQVSEKHTLLLSHVLYSSRPPSFVEVVWHRQVFCKVNIGNSSHFSQIYIICALAHIANKFSFLKFERVWKNVNFPLDSRHFYPEKFPSNYISVFHSVTIPSQVAHCQARRVLHRDIQSQNHLLINAMRGEALI